MDSAQQSEKLYDAIVVGAGPGGSASALFLANAGKSVLVLEKSRFPREKVCGDAFSGKSIGVMRDLGLLSQIEKHSFGIVRCVTMISPNGKRVTVPFPPAKGMEFAGYTIARIDTDNIFFQEVLRHRNITVLQNFQVQSVLKNGLGAAIGVEGASTAGAREKQSFKARIVVGADGAASAVSRSLGLPNSPLAHVYSAVRGYWKGVSGLSDSIELYFIDGVLPGYLWIFPMGNGMANVGLGILSSDLQKGGRHPAAVLTDAIANHPAIKDRFASAQQVGKIGGWSIPNGSFKKQNLGEGWVLVGDAASLVDPFSGEGVGNALASGKFAAHAIISALEKDKDANPIPSSLLQDYPKNVDVYLRPEMANSYKLQRLSRFRFLLNLFIGKAATKPAARQMVIDMLASSDAKKKVESPLFYLKLLLP